MSTILDVQNLHVRFRLPEGNLHAVNGVSFQVEEGEWFGILGESGSGKSVTLMSLLGLMGENGIVAQGRGLFQGRDLVSMRERQLQLLRGREIGVVFQNLVSGLNPYIRVGNQVIEPLLQHGLCTKHEAKRRAVELLGEMGIPDPEAQYESYSWELSGGMRQRVMMAVAMICNPSLLIADEPTTALDSTVQIQVLSVLRQAAEKRKMTTLMVTHDVGVATNVCDRILVMYGGMAMEIASVDEFIHHSAHPYTLGLKSSVVDLRDRSQPLRPIPGMAKTWWESPKGCPFAERCPWVVDQCRVERPTLRALSSEHQVACHRAEEVSAHVG